MFIAGVVHWIGQQAPNGIDLQDRPLAAFAFAHLKVITESGGSVLGETLIRYGDAPLSAEATWLSAWGFGVPKVIAARLARTETAF